MKKTEIGKMVMYLLLAYGGIVFSANVAIGVFVADIARENSSFARKCKFILQAQEKYGLHFDAQSDQEARRLLDEATDDLLQYNVDFPGNGRFLLLVFRVQQYLLATQSNRDHDAAIIRDTLKNEFDRKTEAQLMNFVRMIDTLNGRFSGQCKNLEER